MAAWPDGRSTYLAKAAFSPQYQQMGAEQLLLCRPQTGFQEKMGGESFLKLHPQE